MDNQIKSVCARQIFDSKCRPIIEVDVITEGGVLGRGSASTGTSVGMYEAVILVDGDPNRFGGKSVYHAIDNVNNIIGPAIIGMDVTDQAAIDRRMIELDGTPNKSELGGNAIYATSIACIKAAARTQHMELYRYIAGGSIKTIPIPTFNSINGGTYGKFCMGIQEFTFCPYRAENMAEAVEIAMKVFPMIGQVITEYQHGRPAKVGHYYGWEPPTEDPDVVMQLLHEAVLRCGCENKVAYALDCASSEVYDAETQTYYMNGRQISRDEMIDFGRRMSEQYKFLYIEDLLNENDWEGYTQASKAIDKTILIGDDFIVTNVERLKRAYQEKAVGGFIFKPNQVGTITESLETHNYAKAHFMITVPSQRGGGVIDDVAMDLCLALEVPAVKNSAPRSGERIYACNMLYRAADQNPDAKLYDFSKLQRFED